MPMITVPDDDKDLPPLGASHIVGNKWLVHERLEAHNLQAVVVIALNPDEAIATARKNVEFMTACRYNVAKRGSAPKQLTEDEVAEKSA